MNWFYFFGLQLVFITILLGCGYTLSLRVERAITSCSMYWIDRVNIAAVLVVLILAIFGVAIAFVPWSWRFPVGFYGMFALIFISIALIIKKRYFVDFLKATAGEKIFFGGYVILSALALAMALWPVALPKNLMDGPYVAKQNVLGVRVQYITGNLPADNSIPHVVSEYLLRDISFKSERPIMPGQEVSNRPILASLVILPFRAAVDMPQQWQGSMPRFDYVGSSWPDFSVLMEADRSYLVSLTVGVALNGLLLLALGSFAVRVNRMSGWLALAVVGMILTSPYFLFQTLFTWPKSLAAFFILFAFVAEQKIRSSVLAGICLGLAYLSHPYAIVFFAAHLIWKLACLLRIHLGWKRFDNCFDDNASQVLISGLYILASFALVVLPWVFWSKYFLDIPSDLVSQNFFQPGQKIVDFFWVRFVNLLSLILPTHLIIYPFDPVRVVSASTINIAGAVGFCIFLFATHRLFINFDLKRQAVYFINWLFPVMMLVFVFSNQAVPALHGLQGPIALLLLIGVVNLFQVLNKRFLLILLIAQLGLNSILFLRYMGRLL